MRRYNTKRRENENIYSTTVEGEDGTEIIDLVDETAYVDAIVISDENCQYLFELISQLDDKYKDVLYLKVMGMEYEEISQILQITEALTRQRISRARRKLLEMGGEKLHGIYKK